MRDIVLSNNNWNQAVNIAHWIEYMKRSVSEEEVLNKWMPTYYNEDKPAKLTDHLMVEKYRF